MISTQGTRVQAPALICGQLTPGPRWRGTLEAMTEERWDEHEKAVRRPHRPLPMPSAALEGIADEIHDPAVRRERAYATASALLQAGRDDPALVQELVRLDETVGLDGLRELWGAPEDDGLPAALWSLYLLRAWLVRQGPEAARLYRAGRAHAPVADAVAGVPDAPAPVDLLELADAVLTTALLGDPPGAMDRAAAVHRVLACGRFALAESGETHAPEGKLAEGNLRAAARLECAAAAWRAGDLV